MYDLATPYPARAETPCEGKPDISCEGCKGPVKYVRAEEK